MGRVSKNHKAMVKYYFFENGEEGCLKGCLLTDIMNDHPQELEGYLRIHMYAMADGITTYDKKYLFGNGLKSHCKLLHLNYSHMTKIIKYFLYKIDNKIKWERPSDQST